MNTATIMDIAWEGAQVAFRLIMAARTRRDAEALRNQLKALGPAQRADVDAIERMRRGELADAETAALPRGERVRLAPDFPGGPLEDGD